MNESGVWDEHWFEPRDDGTVAGSLRWVRPDGSLGLLELFSVEHAAPEPGDAERPMFFIRHFNAGLTPWARERDRAPRYTIERMDREWLVVLAHPDRRTMIRYERLERERGIDRMSAEVLGRGDEQDPWQRRVFLVFERTD